MPIHDAILNTNSWGTGFQQLSSWPYATPASYYFWAGFAFVFCSGLVYLAVKAVKNLIGGGGYQ